MHANENNDYIQNIYRENVERSKEIAKGHTHTRRGCTKREPQCLCNVSVILYVCVCVCVGENKRKLTLHGRIPSKKKKSERMNEKKLVSNASLIKCSFFSFTCSIEPATYSCCFCSFSFHSSTLIYLYLSFFVVVFVFVSASVKKEK